MPTRKVGSGVLAGGITVMIVWALKAFSKVDMPAEVASGLTVIITFIAQYFVKETE